MLRSVIAFLLITTVLSATFSRYLVYASFELNRNIIASKLCENRAKPKLNCKGKCYLAKKIKQAEEKEKRDEQQFQKNPFQEGIFTERFRLNAPSAVELTCVTFELLFDLPQRSASIFHPPQV